jgi:hypothetical protein
MGKVVMSIQEGLNELSTLEKRIQKALTRRMQFGAVVIGDKAVNGYKDNEDFQQKVKSTYESVKALINRRTLIKRAIVKKNAEVVIKINEQEMTLAEAIERKNSIQYEEQLLAEMERQYTQLMNELGDKKEYYRDKLDRHIEMIVGKDNKEKKEKYKDDVALLDYFNKEHEPKFIDPLDLKEEIEKLELSIATFKEKVDNVLTAANVMNNIEFEEPSVKELEDRPRTKERL